MAQLDVIQEFREDHRQVRDRLLELADAFSRGAVAEGREILGRIDRLVGPHFRYEEEALYPALRRFLGEYVDQLLSEHDGAIATARTAAQLLEQDSLSPQECMAGAQAARSLLVHVSNCDGLAILSERLAEDELDSLAERLQDCREAGVPLLLWAETIRQRPAVAQVG